MHNSMYQIQALADIANEYLKTIYGEFLIVNNSNMYNFDMIQTILRKGKYTSRYRLFLLYPDEKINYEIPQSDIINDAGNYTENYQNGQRRNANISLVNINGQYTPNINSIWVYDKFRLDVGVEYNDEVFWFPRGIYIMGNPSVQHNDSDKQISLSLVDKFALLEGHMGTLETTYEIPEGTDIEIAIKAILTIDSGSGYALDLKPIIYDHSFKGRRTPYTIRKDAGSNFGEIILELASILGAECFYNDIGNLCFIPINETVVDENKPIIWDFSDEQKEFISSNSNYDFENVVNEVDVIGDNINNKIVSAVARNEDPESPICIQRIGRRVKYLNDAAIYSDELAQDRANYELRCCRILGTKISISTTFNPLLFVDNIITIEDSYYKYKREKFLIQSISYSLGSSNQMTITCSALSNLNTSDEETKSYLADNAHNFITTVYQDFLVVTRR